MIKLSAVLMSLLLTVNVYATNSPSPPTQTHLNQKQKVSVNNKVSNKSASVSKSSSNSKSSSASNSTSTSNSNANNAVDVSNNSNNSSTNDSQATASGNSTITNVEGDVFQARKIPVSTAYSAGLTSGMDVCLGSFSAGVQIPAIGVTGGKTTLDAGCKLIKETHLLMEFGYTEAACYRMRAGEEGKQIDAAMTAAGIDCRPKPTVEVKTEVFTPAELPPAYVTKEELDRVFRATATK